MRDKVLIFSAINLSKRSYLAIVHGNFGENSGLVDAPIGRDHFNRKKMAVTETGKNAVTHFTVLEHFKIIV